MYPPFQESPRNSASNSAAPGDHTIGNDQLEESILRALVSSNESKAIVDQWGQQQLLQSLLREDDTVDHGLEEITPGNSASSVHKPKTQWSAPTPASLPNPLNFEAAVSSPPELWHAWSPRVSTKSDEVEEPPKPARYPSQIYELPEATILTGQGTSGNVHNLFKVSDITVDSGLQVVGDPETDRRNEDACPPLVKAACHGRGASVEKILARGEPKNAVHPETKRTALIEAAEKGYFHIVELLLDHGCSTKCRDSWGMTALHHAAQNGSLLVAKALLSHGAAASTPASTGLTPLHLATWVQNSNMVALLLERGADVSALDTLQRTALHVAASCGLTDICNTLVDYGANTESRDGNLKTPLQLSIEAQYFDTSELLLSLSELRPTDPAFVSAFFAAVEVGHLQMVDSFIRKGATFNSLQGDAYKPIIFATKSGNPDMVELMVRNQAKIKERDEKGWTALHYAAHYGYIGLIERFADKEIPTNVTTFKKETPLHLAIRVSNLTATDTLLRGQGRSCVFSTDSYSQEPLHHAVRVRNTDIVSLLISNGANVSSKNAFGWKPLHIAVAYGSLPIVTHLINHGASIEDRLSPTNLKQSQTLSYIEDGHWAEARWPFPGSKPLHLAIEFGHDDIARYLIDHGAKIDSTCSEGWRPLHLAAFTSSLPMVEHLLATGAYPHAVTDTLRQRTPLDISKFRSRAAPLPINTARPITTPPSNEADAARVWWLLNEAMASTPKKANEIWKKQIKVFAGKGPEEKWECLKAACVAENVVGLKRIKQQQRGQQTRI